MLRMCWKTRKDSQKLQDKLREQKDAEKHSLIEQLTSLKDAELQAMKQGWESKVNELLLQVRLSSALPEFYPNYM